MKPTVTVVEHKNGPTLTGHIGKMTKLIQIRCGVSKKTARLLLSMACEQLEEVADGDAEELRRVSVHDICTVARLIQRANQEVA